MDDFEVRPGEIELRRRGSDVRSNSCLLPNELELHQEILAQLDLQRFISWKSEGGPRGDKVSALAPLELSKYPCTNTSVARELLRRLAEDCSRYCEILSARQTPVVCEDLQQPQICVQRLGELEKVLEASAKEDYQKLRAAIATLELEANELPNSEDVFEFKLKRDLCRLEEHISFEYTMSCLVSSVAEEDLRRMNPHQRRSWSDVMCHALTVALLSGRQLQARRAAQLCRRLASRLAKQSCLAELATLQQEMQFLAELLTERRCYLRQARPIFFDPRFLIFEFMQQIVLRPRQVEMVEWFLQSYKEGNSRVQQMIMGAGKTTVVGPLLSTMLASPEVLVTQVMPSPLLDQSRQILRSSFSKLTPKRIVTFQFDRQVEDCPETIQKIYSKLEAFGRLMRLMSFFVGFFLGENSNWENA
eukprot:symbB.v1.2.001251.t1/scaffold63.1/size477159/22